MHPATRTLGALALSLSALASTSPAHANAQPPEDGPSWSCVDDGNRICGPDNANHVPAGCYDDGGVLWAEWPCTAWTPADGYRHGDGSITYPAACQINLYSGEIDCSGRDLGPGWDSDPASYV